MHDDNTGCQVPTDSGREGWTRHNLQEITTHAACDYAPNRLGIMPIQHYSAFSIFPLPFWKGINPIQ